MRSTLAFRVLKRLASLPMVHLYLPEVCRREFLTARLQEFDRHVESAQKALSKLRNYPPAEKNRLLVVRDLEILEASRDLIEREFADWLQESSAETLPVENAHGTAAINAYFEGAPPFEAPKNRKDFPDAFVYQAIDGLRKKLHAQELFAASQVAVVTGDKNLGACLSKLEGVQAVLSVKQLVDEYGLQALLERSENLTFFNRLFERLQGDEGHELFQEKIGERLVGNNVDGMNPEFEATFSSMGGFDKIEYTGEVDDVGGDLYSVTFSTQADCVVEYYLPVSVWHSMEPEDLPMSLEEWNDHVLRAENEFSIDITGAVTFEIKEGRRIPENLDTLPLEQVLELVDVDAEVEEMRLVEDERTRHLGY